MLCTMNIHIVKLGECRRVRQRVLRSQTLRLNGRITELQKKGLPLTLPVVNNPLNLCRGATLVALEVQVLS